MNTKPFAALLSSRGSRLVGLGLALASLGAGCADVDEPSEEEVVTATAQEALVSVSQPDFAVPDVGYYCSIVWPTAGFTMAWSNPGDANTLPCAGAAGAKITRTGMYSATGLNIVEAWCDPNYYWVYEGYGTDPLNWTYNDVAKTPTNGNCIFRVTIGSSLRAPIAGPATLPKPVTSPAPAPDPSAPYVVNPAKFGATLATKLASGKPTPVGYQIAVRDPQGTLVYSTASGSVTAGTALPATAMTTNRRFDVASMSKTITATAMVAALEDIASPPHNTTSLGITLDSSILPYLPSNWKPAASVANVSFRMLLRHTAGFCAPNAPAGDSYDEVKSMVEYGPSDAMKGTFNYCNSGYALMRILLPYVVDGPAAYKPFESNAALNAEITGYSYRNYVRGRVLAPIGLAAVDDFYTGANPSTVYFDESKSPIPDHINILGSGGYDLRADHQVLTAGSGNWTLSAEEYSAFIASLWQGKIVSQASVTTMLAQQDPNAWLTGIGNFGSQLALPDGATKYDFNEAGGGYAGGPQGVWMTFFNGYTAVLLLNTAWGLPGMGYQALEGSFLTAVTPSAWTCNANYYNANDGCDCNCGAWDPDCNSPAPLFGCSAGQHCALSGGTGVCAP